MSREMCYRCYWPRRHCWCGSITPMPSRTKFVFLMHPYEARRVKANTGRLTHLCLADSELHLGIGFDDHEAVQALLHDPRNYPVLLYPGREAVDLSRVQRDDPQLSFLAAQLTTRRLVVFLLDATWRLVRPMFRLSTSLQQLPRIMFSGAAPSRYRIKRQPEPGCLSTLEATHELLVALERSGLDTYRQPTQLLDLFARMQDFQLHRTAENAARGDRRRGPHGNSTAGESAAPTSGPKRRRIFPGARPPADGAEAVATRPVTTPATSD